MVEAATAIPDDLHPGGEGWPVLGDAFGDGRDVREELGFSELEWAEAVVAVDGPFLSGGFGASGEGAPDGLFEVVGVLNSIYPCTVESAVVVSASEAIQMRG